MGSIARGIGVDDGPARPLGQPRQVPRLSRRLVDRPRLITELDGGSPLTLVRAPLGFGKSTLVAQWLVGQSDAPKATVWLTVNQDSADTDGFWQSLLDALVDAGVGLHSSSPVRSTRLQVRRMLADAAFDVVMVVDAFDRVIDDGVDLDLLDVLRVSPNLRLVVCLRGHRQFPPHAYLDLDFTVVPAEDLLLTRGETETMLEAFGVDLGGERVAAIHADLGGWPEPTRAMAIALGRSASGAGSDSLTATRVVTNYLRQRILPPARDRGAEFALMASLLEPGGMRAATGPLEEDPSRRAQLTTLEADGLVYDVTESNHTSYQWPPAARRAILSELQGRDPELRSRIARLCADRNQPGDALHHAVAARDWPLALEIVNRSWWALMMSEGDVLGRALFAIPLEVTETSPLAMVVRDSYLRLPDDRFFAAMPDLPAEEAALREIGSGPAASRVLDIGLATMMALRRRGLFARAMAYGDRLEVVGAVAAVKRSTEVAAQMPGFWIQLGLVRMLAGEICSAERPLLHAYETAHDSPLPYVRTDAAGKTALAHSMAGDTVETAVWLDRYEDAARSWLRSQDAADHDAWIRRVIASTALTARLVLAVDRLDLEHAAALAAAKHAEPGREEFWAFSTYAHALLALHTGDAMGGLRAIDRARAAYPAVQDEASTARLILARIESDLLLALGRPARARAVLLTVGRDDPALRVPTARLELLAGHTETALGYATDLGWVRRAHRRAQLEMSLIEAVAAHRLGQPKTASRALARAVNNARATGLLRPFVTVPRAELVAIAELLPSAMASFLDADALRHREDLFPARAALVDLSNKEQVVFEHVAEGLLVQQIADRLFVSENTVKSHLKAIYRKLGAKNRTEAVARGRQFGFLNNHRTDQGQPAPDGYRSRFG